jgi:hypothetical protein
LRTLKMKKVITALIIMVLFLTSVTSTFAANGINRRINFQGKVVNKGIGSTDGTNVTDGNYDFRFSVWSTLSAGTSLWTEVWNSGSTQVFVNSGIFQVALGTYTSFPDSVNFNSDSLFVSVNFNSDGEMSPRIQMAAVPYAFNAEKVMGLTVTATDGTLSIGNSKTITFGDNFTTIAGVGITLNQSLSTTDSPDFAGLSFGGTAVTSTAKELNYLTGLAVGNTGALFYASGVGITQLDIGTSGYILMSSGTNPVWVEANLGGGTTYSFLNGLTDPGTHFVGLGGSLTENTQIGLSGFNFSFLGLGGTQSLFIGASGYVGIGMTNPVVPLDINGGVRLGLATGTTYAGTIGFSGTVFHGYDGSSWVNLGKQGADMTKILMLDAGGSAVAEYAATSAGLTSALAASTSGDTVLLPITTITLTSGVSVPAYVTLMGQSRERTVLGAGGSYGSLIELGAGSVIDNLSVGYTATSISGTIAAVYGPSSAVARNLNITVVPNAGSGTSTFYGLYMASLTVGTVIDNINVLIDGNGSGTTRYGIYVHSGTSVTNNTGHFTKLSNSRVYNHANINNQVLYGINSYNVVVTDSYATTYGQYNSATSYGIYLDGSGYTYVMNSTGRTYTGGSSYGIYLANANTHGYYINAIGQDSEGGAVVQGLYVNGSTVNGCRATSNQYGIYSDSTSTISNCNASGSTNDVYVNTGSTMTVSNVSYSTSAGSGVIAYSLGDKANYTVEDYHAADIETGVLTRHLPLGTTAGQTIYYSGTSWTISNNVFNNGTLVGIGTTDPVAKLSVNGDLSVGTSATIGSNLSVGGSVTLSGIPIGIGTTVLYIGAGGVLVQGTLPSSGAYSWVASVGTTHANLSSGSTLTYAAGAGISISMVGNTMTFTNVGAGATYGATNGLNITSGNFGLGGTMSMATEIGTSSWSLNYTGLGGTQSLFIGATGFVGIGTTNPTYKLHMNASGNILGIGDTANNDLFTVTDTAVTSNLPTNLTSSGDVSIAYYLNFTNQSSAYIKSNAPLYLEAGESFESNNMTLRTFNSGQLVLDTPGGLTLMQAQNWNLGVGTTSTTALNIQSGLINLDTQNNRVGIGTTGPGYMLDVGGTLNALTIFQNGSPIGGVGESYAASNGTTMVATNTIGLGGSLTVNTQIGLATYRMLFIGAGGTQSLFIGATGSIGIGTTNPLYKLEVTGAALISSRLGIGATGTAAFNVSTDLNVGTSATILGNLSAGSSVTLSAIPAGVGTSVLYIASNGNITKGTLPVTSVGNTKAMVLSPEYAGASLSADGSGTTAVSMTSDNTLNAGGIGWKNYYQLSSTEATLQDYSVIVRMTLPKDFGTWQTGTCPGATCALEFAVQTGVGTTDDNYVSYIVSNDADTPGTAVCSIGATASTAWGLIGCAESVLNDGGAPEWDAAGETAVVRIKMAAKNTGSALSRIGDIILRYNSIF